MDTDINPSATGAALVLMATASLFTMLSLSQINNIVHGDLYRYGLQFSYRWAMPYWVFSGEVFALSWVNISISIIVTLYVFRASRSVSSFENTEHDGAIGAAPLDEQLPQRQISEYVASQAQQPFEPYPGPLESFDEQSVDGSGKVPEGPPASAVERDETTEEAHSNTEEQLLGYPDEQS